jgi:hypothetical protein
MSLSIIASITDKGRSALADLLQSGVAFTVTDFVTGGGGHDSGDPQVALTPDPALTTLPGQTFGPKPLTDKILVTPYCVRYVCDLDFLEAVGNLSNIGLIATYTYSPIPNDPIVGTNFLFAVGNSPLVVKTDAEQRTINVEVEF